MASLGGLGDVLPNTKKASKAAASQIVAAFTLLCICIMAFSVRLFSVVKYESVIHEFDPYFNYRVTQFLTKEGFYNLWNWFDDRTWYPLGRVVGGTVYPVRFFSPIYLAQIDKVLIAWKTLDNNTHCFKISLAYMASAELVGVMMSLSLFAYGCRA